LGACYIYLNSEAEQSTPGIRNIMDLATNESRLEPTDARPGGGERVSWLYAKEFENLISPSARVF
jgi:hypothetical protein